MAEQSVQVVNELRVQPSAPILRPFRASDCILEFTLAQYLRKHERAKCSIVRGSGNEAFSECSNLLGV